MIVSIVLLFTVPMSFVFFVIYTVGGLTDIADGYIARKYNCTSHTGAVLDSIADFLLIAITIFLFMPVLKLPLGIWLWILGIACIRLQSVGVGLGKYRHFVMIHTYLNKATGLLLFLFPFLYGIVSLIPTAIILCTLASISAVEELLINILSSKLDRNKKSIFYKEKTKLDI